LARKFDITMVAKKTVRLYFLITFFGFKVRDNRKQYTDQANKLSWKKIKILHNWNSTKPWSCL